MNLFVKVLIVVIVLVLGIGLALPQMTAMVCLLLIIEGVRALANIYAPVEKRQKPVESLQLAEPH